MQNIPVRLFLVIASTVLFINAPAWAEQTDGYKKVRRVTNRHIPRADPLQDYQETRKEIAVDGNLEEADFEEADSRVEQAGCKNCQSGGGDTYSLEPAFESSHANNSDTGDYYDDSEPVFQSLGASTYGSSLAIGFDEGTCCDQSFTSCETRGINPCSPFGLLHSRFYIKAQQVFSWGSGQQLPLLVTSTTDGQDPVNLFGGGEIGTASVSGYRVETGLWLDNCQSRAIVLRGFDGGHNDVGLVTDSSRFGNLELPYNQINPNGTLTPVDAFVAVPGSLTGNVNANLSSQVYGGDLLIKKMISRDSLGRWDFLMGYQTARLAESLTLESTRNTVPAGTSNFVRDSFQVKNQFHGATFGFSGDVREGCWYFGGMFKLGLGNMERTVNIEGTQTTTVGVIPSTTDSGLHASSRTNSGRYVLDTFVMTPELNLTAGYRLTNSLDFTVGYNLLRLPKVTRVANALDSRLAVDDSPAPTQLNPAFRFQEFNFTLHSLNLGLQWNY